MEYVACVVALALLQYTLFGFWVGMARGKFGVNAPAVTGHPEFERRYRVQQNTLEQLVVLVPGIFLFAAYVHDLTAAGLGLVYILGRFIYSKSYVSDPKTRGLGFMLSFLPAQILVLGGLVGAVIKLL